MRIIPSFHKYAYSYVIKWTSKAMIIVIWTSQGHKLYIHTFDWLDRSGLKKTQREREHEARRGCLSPSTSVSKARLCCGSKGFLSSAHGPFNHVQRWRSIWARRFALSWYRVERTQKETRRWPGAWQEGHQAEDAARFHRTQCHWQPRLDPRRVQETNSRGQRGGRPPSPVPCASGTQTQPPQHGLPPRVEMAGTQV